MSFLLDFINWSHDNLAHFDEPRNYLESRGSSESQWLEHKIGFIPCSYEISPDSDPSHGDKCFDKENKSEWCEICRFTRWASSYEEDSDGSKKFKSFGSIIGSVVIPLTSYSGEFVGFQTRSINYKSYDTFVLSRRPEGYFFGIKPRVHSIWSSKYVFLTEGFSDHLVFERLVDRNVLSVTTNSVNKAQMLFLKRFVKDIYILFDNDKAGVEGFNKLIRFHSSDFNIRRLSFPAEFKDLNKFWESVGDSKFSRHFLSLLGRETEKCLKTTVK